MCLDPSKRKSYYFDLFGKILLQSIKTCESIQNWVISWRLFWGESWPNIICAGDVQAIFQILKKNLKLALHWSIIRP